MSDAATDSLLLAFYGDDFTGSTDVMETLARAGLRTVLFLAPPTPAQLARYPGLRSFGIAGGSRTFSPAQMEAALPPAFAALRASGAAIVHYKMCSTFDSSPTIGSIGLAIELGRRTFGDTLTPLVIGAPALGRYVAFGNIFARSGLDTDPSRLDRHPTMSRHPVTPMSEADIKLILAAQTKIPVELIDVTKLHATGPAKLRPRLKDAAPIVLFDTITDADLPVIGGLIASETNSDAPLFCVGSSGLEYALTAHWRADGLLSAPATAAPTAGARAPQLVIVSGTCSPVTERQIAYAVAAGFAEIACDSAEFAADGDLSALLEETVARAQSALTAGQPVIFHTARGPEDPRSIGYKKAALRCAGDTPADKLANAAANLSRNLALLLELALTSARDARGVVCGGDTSTNASRTLGIEALEFIAPVAPGAPLCRIHAPGRTAHGREFLFKGGQNGRDSFFTELAQLPVFSCV
ncbi:MAG: four-carbon acid sugar kinase family protein [Opitutus sp.]